MYGLQNALPHSIKELCHGRITTRTLCKLSSGLKVSRVFRRNATISACFSTSRKAGSFRRIGPSRSLGAIQRQSTDSRSDGEKTISNRLLTGAATALTHCCTMLWCGGSGSFYRWTHSTIGSWIPNTLHVQTATSFVLMSKTPGGPSI